MSAYLLCLIALKHMSNLCGMCGTKVFCKKPPAENNDEHSSLTLLCYVMRYKT